MRTKRRIHFGYLWNGLVHLDDGSEWQLADASRRRDVTWWQTGEAVELQSHRDCLILRNLTRAEAIPLVPTIVELELAA